MKRFLITTATLLSTAALQAQQIDLPLLGRSPLNIYSAMTFVPGGGGVLTDCRVRVRAYPTLNARIVGYLDRGDRVEVLERSGLEQSIGEMRDFWYRIRTEDGLAGWSYGHFIDLQ